MAGIEAREGFAHGGRWTQRIEAGAEIENAVCAEAGAGQIVCLQSTVPLNR